MNYIHNFSRRSELANRPNIKIERTKTRISIPKRVIDGTYNSPVASANRISPDTDASEINRRPVDLSPITSDGQLKPKVPEIVLFALSMVKLDRGVQRLVIKLNTIIFREEVSVPVGILYRTVIKEDGVGVDVGVPTVVGVEVGVEVGDGVPVAVGVGVGSPGQTDPILTTDVVPERILPPPFKFSTGTFSREIVTEEIPVVPTFTFIPNNFFPFNVSLTMKSPPL